MYSSVDNLLREAGWLPGREVDTSEVVAGLESSGFSVSAAAKDFMLKYLGLQFVHDPCIEVRDKKVCTKTTINPIAVATRRDLQFAGNCESVTGVTLCPVGTDSFHQTIYVSPDGRFWSGKDSYVYAYAEDEEQLFAKMLAGERPFKVGEWQSV